MSPSLEIIKRNGKPERVLFIPSARDSFSPSCPSVPAAAEPVDHRSACGLSSMEA